MDLTGQPDGEPMRGGVAFADVLTGIYSAVAIHGRAERARPHRQGQLHRHGAARHPGRVLANQASSYLVSGVAPERMGNAHPAVVPYQVFPVADGHVIIAVRQRQPVRAILRAVGAPRLAQDERFAPMPAAW